MRGKLEQKCPPTSDEAMFLGKTFKFFDIQNKGSVTQDQFVRAVEKLGVVTPDSNVSKESSKSANVIDGVGACAEHGHAFQLLRQEW